MRVATLASVTIALLSLVVLCFAFFRSTNALTERSIDYDEDSKNDDRRRRTTTSFVRDRPKRDGRKVQTPIFKNGKIQRDQILSSRSSSHSSSMRTGNGIKKKDGDALRIPIAENNQIDDLDPDVRYDDDDDKIQTEGKMMFARFSSSRDVATGIDRRDDNDAPKDVTKNRKVARAPIDAKSVCKCDAETICGREFRGKSDVLSWILVFVIFSFVSTTICLCYKLKRFKT